MPPKRVFLDERLYVQVSTIPGAGKGLFTVRPIPPGAIIGEYTGTILPLSAMYDKSADRNYYVQTLPYFKESEFHKGMTICVPSSIIDGKTMDNKMRWINDARYDKVRYICLLAVCLSDALPAGPYLHSQLDTTPIYMACMGGMQVICSATTLPSDVVKCH
jgi:hypothetical protein